ncbi:MAG TPA: CBS domain-containing protein [Rhizomicrobium sp.]|jgi:CBS domain-containing protein
MLVEQVLLRACERLVVIDASASIGGAANLMAEPHTDLVIVCRDGVAIGVITKTDIIAQLSRHETDLDASVDTIMTREVAYCRSSDPLGDVWQMMKERGFHRIPVIDEKHAPVGIIYARDALQCLLNEIEIDDDRVRGFITGSEYH